MNMQKLLFILLICWNSTLLSQTPATLEQALGELTKIMQQPYRFAAKQQACEAVLTIAPANSVAYLEAGFHLTTTYLEQHQQKAAKDWIDKIEQILSDTSEETVQGYWLHWNYLKAKYANDIEQNREKALIYGIKAVFDAQQNAAILTELCLVIVDALSYLGQYERAEQFLDSYKLVGQLIAQNDISRGHYYLKLATGYLQTEKEQLAQETAKKAIEILQPYAQAESELLAECWYIVGLAAKELHLPNYKVDSLEKAVTNGNRSYQHLAFLGDYYHSKIGDNQKALLLLQEALVKLCPEFTSMDFKDNPPKDAVYLDKASLSIAYLFINKIHALLAYGHKAKTPEESEAWYRAAIHTGEAGLGVFSNYVTDMEGYNIMSLVANENAQLVLGALVVSAQNLYRLTQAEEDLERIFKYMEQGKCLSLYRSLEASRLPPAVQKEKDAFAQQLEGYEQQFSSTSSEEEIYLLANKMQQFVRTYERFLEKTRQDYPNIRPTQQEIQFLRAKDIQQSLAENTAFLQLTMTRRSIHGLLITPDSYQVEQLSKVAAYNEIYKFIQSVNNPLLVQKNKKREFIKKSHGYYQQILGPFEEKLQGKKRLIISPERDLFHLPFELLLRTPAEKPFEDLDFLIKDFEIEYQYSSTLHQKIQQRPTIQDKSLLAFAPVFEDGKGTGQADRSMDLFKGEIYGTSIQNDQFVSLPNSLREVKAISALLEGHGKVEGLLKNKATKENLFNRLTQNTYQFVHIATHSMVHHLDPRLSAIACYATNDAGNLYFSKEFETFPLRADLVVLSSCESGIGRIIEGEALIGLNRSIIYAGARNVLFSLWKVNDEHTADLMTNFYKNYLQTNDYSRALRLAKLNMLENPVTANPRFWAPFVLVGE